jgi:hypothetical protein
MSNPNHRVFAHWLIRAQWEEEGRPQRAEFGPEGFFIGNTANAGVFLKNAGVAIEYCFVSLDGGEIVVQARQGRALKFGKGFRFIDGKVVHPGMEPATIEVGPYSISLQRMLEERLSSPPASDPSEAKTLYGAAMTDALLAELQRTDPANRSSRPEALRLAPAPVATPSASAPAPSIEPGPAIQAKRPESRHRNTLAVAAVVAALFGVAALGGVVTMTVMTVTELRSWIATERALQRACPGNNVRTVTSQADLDIKEE